MVDYSVGFNASTTAVFTAEPEGGEGRNGGWEGGGVDEGNDSVFLFLFFFFYSRRLLRCFVLNLG